MVTDDATTTGLVSALATAVFKGEFFAERYHGTFLPWYRDTLATLEIREWTVYHAALKACTSDSIAAVKSTYQLWYLLLRPLAIVLWIVLEYLLRFVMEHGGRSLQTLAIQTKTLAIGLYRFQISLDRTQLLGEAGLVAFLVGLYYLRRWLLQQTYWARFVQWHKAKKRQAIRSYTEFVHKVARVSKILAMALPHSLFFALGIGLKIFFPGAVRSATYDTPLLPILSVWYPFLGTFSWVVKSQQNTAEDERNNGGGDDEPVSPGKKKKASISERKKKFETATKKTPEFMTETKSLATTKYWLNYWQLYAIVQAVGRCFSMIPIFGRFLTSHPIFHFLSGEFKLFFFVWVFGMERLLGGASGENAFLAEALPLRLIQTYTTPLVLQLHGLVSDAIPRDIWQKWVVSKTKTTLDVFVLVRMLSEDRRDWLVHVAEEARVLTLPSITLLMPGFVTQFGVAYVRYIVPSAKSSQAKSKSAKFVYLQYWILHCCVSGLLSQLEGVLWWIPFSNHLVFLLWSYLILPQAIQHWYGILESDLMVFGILPKNSNDTTTDIHETRIARFFHWVVSWLPSASVEVASVSEQGDSKKDTADGENTITNETPSCTTPEENVSKDKKDKDV